MVSQEVDLVREEDARDRAAGAAIFTRLEILFEILVDKPSPYADLYGREEIRLYQDYRSN